MCNSCLAELCTSSSLTKCSYEAQNSCSFLAAAHLTSRFCFISARHAHEPHKCFPERVSDLLPCHYEPDGVWECISAAELSVEKESVCRKTRATYSLLPPLPNQLLTLAHVNTQASTCLIYTAPYRLTVAGTGRQQADVWVIECEGEARRQA